MPTPAPVTIAPCRDAAWLDAVVRHPEVREGITNDALPAAEQLHMADFLRPGVVILQVLVGPRPVGFFALIPLNPAEYEVHTVMLPEARGRVAFQAARLGIQWTFQHTAARTLRSFCPGCQPQTLLFSRRAGFKVDAVEPAAWPKHGRRFDLTRVSLSFADWFKRAGLGPLNPTALPCP